MEALLETQQLSREYGPRCVVDRLDLSLRRGEILGLLGPNGAGKSTALRMICGDLAPSEGRISICGHDLINTPLAAKRHLGYLPERPPLHPDQRVDEYLSDCARLRRIPRSQIRARVEETKQRCGLGEMGRRLIGNLSKGFRQRVGIAQAIQHRPDVVVLDEPTDGLDPLQIREVRELIRSLAREAGVILSSHILPEIQATCNRVLILNEGHVAYQGEITPPAAASLKLELANPPDDQQLAALPSLAAVNRLHTDYFHVILKPEADASRLAEEIVGQGWGLKQLTPETLGLEQIFMEAISRRGP
jgi:ABC-2 type transport system ATP-binding protein